MKKIKKEEMKTILGGLECGPRCECILAFMDYGGWEYEQAYEYCTDLFGRGNP